MFEKLKLPVVVMVVGLLLGWGAWKLKNNPASLDAQAVDREFPIAATPQATPPTHPAIVRLIGKNAPDFAIPTSNWINASQPLALKELRGKVVLLEFFRTHCPHCIKAAPLMNALHARFSSEGLQIIGIQSPSEDNKSENDWQAVQEVVKAKMETPFPVAFDKKSKVMRDVYKLDRYPAVLLIGRSGKVVLGFTGHNDAYDQALVTAIRQQLAK